MLAYTQGDKRRQAAADHHLGNFQLQPGPCNLDHYLQSHHSKSKNPKILENQPALSKYRKHRGNICYVAATSPIAYLC
jgi:hypothetical protein